MMYLVTVKLSKNPNHDPKNKVWGPCAVSGTCSDSTGEHHTVLARDEDHLQRIKANFGHITRVEAVSGT